MTSSATAAKPDWAQPKKLAQGRASRRGLFLRLKTPNPKANVRRRSELSVFIRASLGFIDRIFQGVGCHLRLDRG